jgi:hypothetical protein
VEVSERWQPVVAQVSAVALQQVLVPALVLALVAVVHNPDFLYSLCLLLDIKVSRVLRFSIAIYADNE